MIETINGIDLLIGGLASAATWAVCRIGEAQRRTIAREDAKTAAKVAYRMGHHDGMFDQRVMFGTGDPPHRGLDRLLADIRNIDRKARP